MTRYARSNGLTTSIVLFYKGYCSKIAYLWNFRPVSCKAAFQANHLTALKTPDLGSQFCALQEWAYHTARTLP